MLHADKPVEMDGGPWRKKVGGVLNHSVHCLKKVARMSGSDRTEVLKIIRKQERKRQRELCLQQAMAGTTPMLEDGPTTSSSVNADWQHWVVLRGNQSVKDADVRGVGKDIGLDFPDASQIRFAVLRGEDKGVRSGEVVGKEGVGGSASSGCV